MFRSQVLAWEYTYRGGSASIELFIDEAEPKSAHSHALRGNEKR